MKDIKRIYHEGGIELHPDTEKLIQQYLTKNTNFSMKKGPPGLHSEVQALNQIYQEAGGANNLREIYLGTKNIQGGSDFIACPNCGGIIPSNVKVFTGR